MRTRKASKKAETFEWAKLSVARQKPLPLRLWEELEIWQQEDNHFIESGYRSATGSVAACFSSWTYVHNETVNIYSHLIGAAIFIAFATLLYRDEILPRYALASAEDKIVFLVYFISVAVCFCLSATYHTVMNHSYNVDMFGAQLDFQGVILLMWSATVPLVFYGFFCDPDLRYAYWTMLSVLALACSVSTFQPRFRQPFLRPVRAATFGSLAFLTMLPVVHGVYRNGWKTQNQQMGITWVLMTLGLNTLGGSVYAFKVPERWFRRKFDIVGASHQVFHVLVVLAALTFAKGMFQAFDYVHAEGNDVCRKHSIA